MDLRNGIKRRPGGESESSCMTTRYSGLGIPRASQRKGVQDMEISGLHRSLPKGLWVLSMVQEYF